MATALDGLQATWGFRHHDGLIGPWSSAPPPHYAHQVVMDECAVREQITQKGYLNAYPETVHTEDWLWEENHQFYAERLGSMSSEALRKALKAETEAEQLEAELAAFERKAQQAEQVDTIKGNVVYVPDGPASDRPAKRDKKAVLAEMEARREIEERRKLARAAIRKERQQTRRVMRSTPPLRSAVPQKVYTHISLPYTMYNGRSSGRVHFCAAGSAEQVKSTATEYDRIWSVYAKEIVVHSDGTEALLRGENEKTPLTRMWLERDAV